MHDEMVTKNDVGGRVQLVDDDSYRANVSSCELQTARSPCKRRTRGKRQARAARG